MITCGHNKADFIGLGRSVISFVLLGTIVLVQISLVRLSAIPYSKLERGNEDNSRWPGIRSNAVREMLGPFRGRTRVNDNFRRTEPLLKGLKVYGDSGPEPESETQGPETRSEGNLAGKSSDRNGPGVDVHGRVQMGVSSEACDDAKTNLTLDWNLSPVNYTCFHPETRFPIGYPKPPLLECTTLPEEYMPKHFCMDQPITYEDNIPSYGDHRPLWPVFGEYLFVPRERWLHNIEHGAVVMLYHPCAHPMEVSRLKQVVSECIGKHVITPSTLLSPDRPLALVAWGCRLLMSLFDEPLAVSFIEERGLKGPEGNYTKEGQYTFGLIKPANETRTARYDRTTCPSSRAASM